MTAQLPMKVPTQRDLAIWRRVERWWHIKQFDQDPAHFEGFAACRVFMNGVTV